MSNKLETIYLNLWKDICFYEVYKDIIVYENYIVFLSNKYCIDMDEIIIKIAEVKRTVKKRIQEHQEREKDYQPLFKTECKEEKIKTIIEYNRQREEIKESTFGEPSITVKKIKKLGFLKTRK